MCLSKRVSLRVSLIQVMEGALALDCSKRVSLSVCLIQVMEGALALDCGAAPGGWTQCLLQVRLCLFLFFGGSVGDRGTDVSLIYTSR